MLRDKTTIDRDAARAVVEENQAFEARPLFEARGRRQDARLNTIGGILDCVQQRVTFGRREQLL